jgi:hypothetical protein
MASMDKVGERNGDGVYRIRWRVDGRQTEKWVQGFDWAKAEKSQIENDELAGRERRSPRRDEDARCLLRGMATGSDGEGSATSSIRQ